MYLKKWLKVPYTVVWKILRKILKIYPYKLEMEEDLGNRYNFSFTFHDWWVKTENCRIWCAKNAQEIARKGLNDEKVVKVWCAVGDFIIGLFFYKEIHKEEAAKQAMQN